MTDAGVLPLDGGTARSVRAVALVGFMAAGKTTVGQKLARRTGWPFEDLDQLIETNQGQTIREIFAQRGEAAFRELESSLLREFLHRPPPFILALGGGAFIQSEIQNLLRAAGIPVVFLDAPADELYRRGEQEGLARPLRGDEESFRQLYQRRRPVYLQAALSIETSRKSVEAIVEEIISGLNLSVAEGVCDCRTQG